jgi:hypothetical protein
MNWCFRIFFTPNDVDVDGGRKKRGWGGEWQNNMIQLLIQIKVNIARE